MNRAAHFLLFVLFIFSASLSSNLAAQSVSQAPASSFAPAASNSREEQLYDEGTASLDSGSYQQALEKFSAVAAIKGRRADAALYWKAYAYNKLGQRAEALATVADLRRSYPQSRWLKDAGALELEVKQAQGRPVSPETEEDCELKVMAINSLMNSDEDRAVTMLENVLRSNSCEKAKDKAVFVLSQSDSPRAQQALGSIARAQQFPELQRTAIQYLGTNDTAGNKRELVGIYNSTGSAEIKRAVIQAFVTSDAQQELLSVIEAERDPELRRDGIHSLGAMGAQTALRQMYASSQSSDEKKDILQALAISDDAAFLAQVARSPGDIAAREAAIHGLGIAGEHSRPLLVEIYNSDHNSDIRDAAIEGLFINDDADDLIALARKETDREMKRHIIEKLSVMDSPKARDYMLEILNK